MTTAQPIIPLLVCADIEAEHDFLVRAFGFSPGGVSRDEDGNVVHGEVELGGTPIWLHRSAPEHALVAPDGGAQQHGGLVVTVDDVDAHHRHAAAAGAHVDSPPADRPYGRREYGASDLEGHRWWFGTPLGA